MSLLKFTIGFRHNHSKRVTQGLNLTLLIFLHGLAHLFMWCVISSNLAHCAESHYLLPKLAITPYPTSPYS